MQFSDQESKAFWPVYRTYEGDLTKVNDERLALIKSYTAKFATMTDADAKTMIDQSIDFESRRTDLKKKYAKEFQKAGLSSLTVAKFLQLEHRLDLIVDVNIASELPSLLIKPAGQSAPHQ
jgi:recombinational DNA repair ATPase RecF